MTSDIGWTVDGTGSHLPRLIGQGNRTQTFSTSIIHLDLLG